MGTEDVSVIVLTKNSQRYLKECLRRVFAQRTELSFEVIVIDSGSTDDTLKIADEFPVKIFPIPPEQFDHGFTRNFGASCSQGQYLMFLTPDAVPVDKRWMQGLVDVLRKDSRIAGVYSRQVPHKDASALTKARVSRFFTFETERRVSCLEGHEEYQKMSPKEKHRFCSFDDVSSCIRRCVWEGVPFPETDFGEDIEWAINVLMSGYEVVYEPDLAVHHSHEYSVQGWYERNRLNARKLSFLFEYVPVSGIGSLLVVSLLTAFRDVVGLFRQGISGSVLFGLLLVPFYAFAGTLGMYRGARDVAETLSADEQERC